MNEDSNQKAQRIFTLLADIRKGDARAVAEAKSIADFFRHWPEQNTAALIFKQSEIEDTQKAFLYKNGLIISFFISAEFTIAEIVPDEDRYTLCATDGRAMQATLIQFSNMWHELPFEGDRVTASHVATAFYACNKADMPDYYDAHTGLRFKDSSSIHYIGESASVVGQAIFVTVCVNTVTRLKNCLPKLHSIWDNIEQYDAMAKNKLQNTFDIPEWELQEVSSITLYERGWFDIFYNLPEETGVEYGKTCFSATGEALKAAFGNY